jgi:ATP-dependent protease Clp ATPase subunit
MIVESMLLNLMFEAPSDPGIKEIFITKETVLEGALPKSNGRLSFRHPIFYCKIKK